jgi:hypothetical protein
MNSNLETASQGELALTDWIRLAGLFIFVAFICFSIVLFCKGANHPPANETQALARSSARTTGLELRPEADPQSVIAVIRSGTRPGSATSLSGAPVTPIQQPLHRSITKGPTIFNAKRTLDIHRHRRYSAMRLAGRQGSVLDQVVSKSVNVLVGMWRHSWETTKVRGRRAAARKQPISLTKMAGYGYASNLCWIAR